MAKKDLTLIKRVTFHTPIMLGVQSIVHDRLSTDNLLDYKQPQISFDDDARFVKITTTDSPIVDKVPWSNIAGFTLA